MKTSWNQLASFASIVFITSTLHAGTFFVQSLGGTDGPPLPFDPTGGTAPISEIGPDRYLVDDSDSESLQSGGMMTANSLDPNDTESGGGSENPAPPNIRNYAKYSQQLFSLLDTNSLAETDTNLLTACAAIPVNTNTTPILQIRPYGPNAIIIKASHFDYSAETRDFTLIVCDKVETPTWKTIDFAGASDAQDGWLVQGTVPQWQVTTNMFILVTNINLIYPAFFRAIPYSGPQVAISGVPSPNDVVSNSIMLNAVIQDLSGVTNEQFEVTADGDPAAYSLSTTNTFSLDTRYNANSWHQVYLNVLGHASVYDPTNPPVNINPFFNGSTYIPLDFENDTYLLFASDLVSPDIGTNYILYSINKAQDVAWIISDPSNGNVVLAATNHISTPGTVAVPWNFTEGDGVTPYSNDTYKVEFIAFDPADLPMTNRIDRHQVRPAGQNIITYEIENPGTSDGAFLNAKASLYIDNTLVPLYGNLYSWTYPYTITDYTPADIGNNRQNSALFPYVLDSVSQAGSWATALLFCVSNSVNYSDFGYYMGHGNTPFIGAGPPGEDYITHYLPSQYVRDWANKPEAQPNWRFRKVVVWCCYSDGPGFHEITSAEPNWPEAFGIRDTSEQTRSLIPKNVGLFFRGLLPAYGYSGTSSHTSVEVAAIFDELWVAGPTPYPGGSDPTYSFAWVFDAIRGNSPEINKGLPAWIGFGYLPYTGIYDSQIATNNVSHIHL
jgi:hypothetical protein